MVSTLSTTISRFIFSFFFGSSATCCLIMSLLFLIILISHNPTSSLSQLTTIHRNQQQRPTKDIIGLNLYPDVFNDNYNTAGDRYYLGTQHQPRHYSTKVVTPLYASIPLSDNVFEKEDVTAAALSTSPAFIIENISDSSPSSDLLFRTISNLCIDVFFKELLDPSGNGNINFVKEWQINYLKTLQAADLRRRRERFSDTNEMFLAYEVKRVTGITAVLTQPLLLDGELLKVCNRERIRDEDDEDDDYYVRGDLLGFVEITQRPYGLGNTLEASPSSSSPSSSEIVSTENDTLGGGINDIPMRPVLTNLAVLRGARRYGIGSKLVDACEMHVRKRWNMNEIVLEVEDYNTKGLEFYRRRGFEILFSDPASRRYDINSSFWLKKVRCRREIMRKVYNNRHLSLMESADNIVRKICETMGNF
mmetsp:Transcript_37635/g.42116  ORF Transcript_37635/g.42116 Transcript_37635/m.42116 type:complete len:420 (-) Transcript_37635:27-1286(-)